MHEDLWTHIVQRLMYMTVTCRLTFAMTNIVHAHHKRQGKKILGWSLGGLCMHAHVPIGLNPLLAHVDAHLGTGALKAALRHSV